MNYFSEIFFSFHIGQVVWHLPHCWSLCSSIPFLISPFLSILAGIAWKFHLPINIEDLPTDCFWSFGYHMTSAQVHLSSVSFVMCIAHQNFCFQYSTFMKIIFKKKSWAIHKEWVQKCISSKSCYKNKDKNATLTDLWNN